MTGEPRQPPLKDLEARLRAAQEHRRERTAQGEAKGGRAGDVGGLGFAFRIGVELVSALLVGVGIGLLLDYWLGTRPWLMIVFFVLGSGAGFLNVYRAVKGYGYAAGYRRGEAAKGNQGTSRRDAESR